MGVTDFVLELQGAKAKIKGGFHWILCFHGNLIRQDDKRILLSNNYSFKLYHIIVTK